MNSTIIPLVSRGIQGNYRRVFEVEEMWLVEAKASGTGVRGCCGTASLAQPPEPRI